VTDLHPASNIVRDTVTAGLGFDLQKAAGPKGGHGVVAPD
jgi:hypothetical protein